MHPAPSVILFTTFSGLGFGLLTALALGAPALTGWPAFWAYGAGFALAAGGLLASTFHLGRPERALHAFTQWRSSWLSREAWLAVAALVVLGLHAIGPVFLGRPFAALGILGAALALATVGATAMIYTQLQTVPRWRQPATPALFLVLALAGGTLAAGQPLPAAIFLVLAGIAQIWHWRSGDAAFARSGTTLATATGLDGGAVRSFEPPHTGGNYLTREMVFVVARRHAEKLRRIAFVAMVALPLLLLALSGGANWGAWAAAPVHVAGVLVARWLFFAEAEHVVGLYYGRGTA